jgi:PPM family protein phosphatase
MRLAIQAATDLGQKRARNEDSWEIWSPTDPAERERRGVLLVLADGMGGARSGDVASQLAVETMVRVYREAAGADALANLEAALIAANRAIFAENERQHELPGMATTLTAAVVRGTEVLIAHVGDSRAYLARDGKIRQLTEDHSLVARLVAEGQMTSDEARLDPRRNLLMRSVGLAANVPIDVRRAEEALAPGDTLLLCSDGLHGLVADRDIASVLAGEDLESVAAQLIALANRAGGSDNITVVVGRALAG